MKVHHLNCATMHPLSERLVNGRGNLFAKATMVCHCLLVETNDGLVLVDSGIGLEDCADAAGRLGKPFLAFARPRLDPQDTAVRQVERLGFARRDVRHIVLTHLDVDHAGGLPDFPEATVHVYRDEYEAAMNPRTRLEQHRYRQVQWAHRPRWQLHESDGETFEGFDRVRAIVEPEVLLLPTMGHTRGHTVVAVKHSEGWLLHCGDAYFNRHELDLDKPWCPPGPAAFQRIVAVDDVARRRNQRRLRELKRARSAELTLFCAHDPDELSAVR